MTFSKIPPIIRVDFGRKLLALFLAVVIWYTVRFEILKTASFDNVPVHLIYDSSRVYVDEPPPPVTVTFRGAKAKLEGIEPSKLAVTVKVPDVEAGVYEYTTSLAGRKHVKPPRGTRLLSIKPALITLKVDRIISREVPVEIQESGRLAPNYQILKREAIPSTVQVRGPSRFVDAMSTIGTKPIVLDASVTDSFQMKEVDLITIPRLSVTPSQVSISYDIARDDDNRKFEDLPVRVLNSVPPVIQPGEPIPPVTVILRGPKHQLAELEADKIHPFIDLSSINQPGSAKVKVGVRVDSLVKFTTEALMPATVTLSLVRASASPPSPVPPVPPAPEE